MTGQGEEDAAGWSRGREEERKKRGGGGEEEEGKRDGEQASKQQRRRESDGWATRPACCSSMDKPKYWACSNDARFPTPAHVRISAWLDQWTARGVVCECDRPTYSPSNRAGRLLLGTAWPVTGCSPCLASSAGTEYISTSLRGPSCHQCELQLRLYFDFYNFTPEYLDTRTSSNTDGLNYNIVGSIREDACFFTLGCRLFGNSLWWASDRSPFPLLF
ncbi:hypothetical protein TEQG_04903 [Trichophyton equinum CBS 127.97]|uniref:Uncharacterized protein n=1 Tax=Trichophyton equinum (strain ATCC MYA-4606 / CBS 127.97) TaxID=559882 RepID=F2PVH5_TRIEC|nr:hypothetical protein TEQG_04903 [Trichophyton equinum CBS 127.97]